MTDFKQNNSPRGSLDTDKQLLEIFNVINQIYNEGNREINNSIVRKHLLLLMLANKKSLNAHTSFNTQGEDRSVLEQQLVENRGGLQLPDSQSISVEADENSKQQISFDLVFQKNDFTLKFKRNSQIGEIFRQALNAEYEDDFPFVQYPCTNKDGETIQDPSFFVCFPSNTSYQSCNEVFEIKSISGDLYFSQIISNILSKIMFQLAYNAVQEHEDIHPSLIQKIFDGSLDETINANIQRLLATALDGHTDLPDLTIQNILDPDLIEIFKKDVIDGVVLQIAQRSINPIVLSEIMRQERFRRNIGIIINIAKNPNASTHDIMGCIDTLNRIIQENPGNIQLVKWCIDGLIAVAQNPKASQYDIKRCISMLNEIIQINQRNQNNKDLVIKCINGLIAVAKNTNASVSNIANSTYWLNKIIQVNQSNQNNKDLISMCIDGLSKCTERLKVIASDSNASEHDIRGCISLFDRIIQENQGNKELVGVCTKGLHSCAERLTAIASDSNASEYDIRGCIDTLNQIIQENQNNKDLVIKCINGLIAVAKNTNASVSNIANSTYWLNKIIQVNQSNQNNKELVNTCTTGLSKCAERLTDIVIDTNASEYTTKKCVKGFNICVEGLINVLQTPNIFTDELITFFGLN